MMQPSARSQARLHIGPLSGARGPRPTSERLIQRVSPKTFEVRLWYPREISLLRIPNTVVSGLHAMAEVGPAWLIGQL